MRTRLKVLCASFLVLISACIAVAGTDLKPEDLIKRISNLSERPRPSPRSNRTWSRVRRLTRCWSVARASSEVRRCLFRRDEKRTFC